MAKNLATEGYIDEKRAAEALGLSRSYLRKLRAQNVGPAYLKVGAACRYHPADLGAWARMRTHETGKDLGDDEWFARNPSRRFRVRPWQEHDETPALQRAPTISIIDNVNGQHMFGLPEQIVLPDPDAPGRWFTYQTGWENSDTYAGLRWALEMLLWQAFCGRGGRPA